MPPVQFTYDPAADFIGVADMTTANMAVGLTDNMTNVGNAVVGNDFVLVSLDRFGLLPRHTKSATAPAAPLDRDLWYDEVAHELKAWNLTAAAWQVVTPTIMREIVGTHAIGTISTSCTYNVPADFPTMLDAEAYLTNFAIDEGVLVTVRVAPGTYNHAIRMRGHPDGERIVYRPVAGSEYNGAAPVLADYVSTGVTVAAVTADRATNVAMVRGKYRVVVNCAISAVQPWPGYAVNILDICFVGANANTGLDVRQWANAYMGGCAFLSFATGISAFNGGMIFDQPSSVGGKTHVVGNTFNGASITSNATGAFGNGGFAINNGNGAQGAAGIAINASFCVVTGWTCNGNNGDGLLASNYGVGYGTTFVADSNVGNGASLATVGLLNAIGGKFRSNGLSGVFVQNAGIIYCTDAIVTNNLDSGIKLIHGIYGNAANATITGNGTYGVYSENTQTNLQSAIITGNKSTGVSVSRGAQCDLLSVTITGNNTAALGAGVGGLSVASGASAFIHSGTISNNAGHGVYVAQGIVYGAFATTNGNTGSGIYAIGCGSVNCDSATSQNNGGYGIFSGSGSFATYGSSTVSGNTLTDMYAIDGSFIQALGYLAASTFSPALNVVGNFNSYIRG